jgi:glycosyltransferase involved in cell wall biosynthesis
MGTLVSIVVPTKDRPATALALTQALLQLPGDQFEVLVQDCGAPEGLGPLLAPLATDSRLRYAHTGRAVSMTENWNAAMERVRGEYVTIVGDDDGVSRKLVDAARWAREQGFDAVAWDMLKVRFYWPDYPEQNLAGVLLTGEHTGAHTEVSPARELERAACGHGSILDYRLPRVYHGLVAFSSLRALRESTGAYFKGLTPDFYSAYALSGYVRATAHVDYPLSFLGHCRESNSARGQHVTHRLMPKEHLRAYDEVDFSGILPGDKDLSITVLAQSLIDGLVAAGRPELIGRIDLATIYAEYLVDKPLASPRALGRYVRSLRALKRDVVVETARLLWRTGLVCRARLRNWASPTGKLPRSRYAARTIAEAMAINDRLLETELAQRLCF